MTVGELEHGRGTPMSSTELSEWKAYFQIVKSEWDSRSNSGTDLALMG